MVRLSALGLSRVISLAGAVLFLGVSGALAYPPAPFHLLYGMVRDEYGTPLNTAGAMVTLETASGVSVSAEIIPDIESGANYRIEVPMDSGLRAGLYNVTALQPLVPFRLKVRVGSAVYLPLQMKGDFVRLGQPGARTRLDLTLGADVDGDGLPDAWEQLIDADLSKVTPGADSDGDGMSNYDEYIAGTYAFDPKDGFRLDLMDVGGAVRVFSFTAINGRSYELWISTDLKTWAPMSFRITSEGSDSALRAVYKAYDTRQVKIEVPADPTPAYYRLMLK